MPFEMHEPTGYGYAHNIFSQIFVISDAPHSWSLDYGDFYCGSKHDDHHQPTTLSHAHALAGCKMG